MTRRTIHGIVASPGASIVSGCAGMLRDAVPCCAAHAMLWNGDYLHQIEGDFGDKTAQLVAQSHQTAIDALEQVSPEEQGYVCTQYPPSFKEAAPASAESHIYAMHASAWHASLVEG